MITPILITIPIGIVTSCYLGAWVNLLESSGKSESLLRLVAIEFCLIFVATMGCSLIYFS